MDDADAAVMVMVMVMVPSQVSPSRKMLETVDDDEVSELEEHKCSSSSPSTTDSSSCYRHRGAALRRNVQMYSCHNNRFSLVIEDQVVRAVSLFLT